MDASQPGEAGNARRGDGTVFLTDPDDRYVGQECIKREDPHGQREVTGWL